ncbi:MAG: DUF1295 domain-containing protein [Bacteroidia bacterium]|nr:DUF1295 domain-containing protein [Bacteroidia bacterium]
MNFYYCLLAAWSLLAIIILLVLLFTKLIAPYGRHNHLKSKMTIANHWGWFWMELPALVLFPLITWIGPSTKSSFLYLLLGLWVLHYFNRSILFPFRLISQGKQMPLLILISALLFNATNGFFNGYYLGFLGESQSLDFSLNQILGLLLFFGGFFINLQADQILIKLRKKGKGYQIPQKGLYPFISCPNYLGEIMEWTGFALLAWNPAAASFALWTFCNLFPRALTHHKWYQEKFPTYPASRKAIIPFLI